MKLQGFGYVHMLLKTKFFNLPNDYYKNYLKKITTIKPQEINSITKKVIKPDYGIIVIVGDSKKFVSQLKNFATVVVLDENLKPIH
jgi:hypothetical protein